MGGPRAAGEIPLLLSFFHLPGEAGGRALWGSRFWLQAPGVRRVRPAPGTVAGGEFDWGGTPVKQ